MKPSSAVTVPPSSSRLTVDTIKIMGAPLTDLPATIRIIKHRLTQVAKIYSDVNEMPFCYRNWKVISVSQKSRSSRQQSSFSLESF